MRKYLFGKKFPGQLSSSFSTQRKTDRNNSHYVTLVLTVPAGEVGCLRLGGGRVVVWVVAGLTGRVGSERERESNAVSHPQVPPPPSSQLSSPSAAAPVLLLN